MRVYLGNSDLSLRGFDYDAAFSRNIGWLTEWEQQELRKKTVALAGLGGVGGAHALTLARLGVGAFHIADFDRFDVANFNRQSGAFMSTVNLEKTAVMGQMVCDINPELRLKIFDRGVDESNLDEFLADADLFVDGIDFFALETRRKIFKRCAELGIPAITAAPIGFGSSYLIFAPGGMSFEKYFRLASLSEERQYVNFALGLTPEGFHRRYLVDPSRLDLAHHRGPSTAAAVQLCAGVVGAEAIKLLLGRGKVHVAPYYHQFDAYRGKWKRGRLRFGNAGPLQSLKRYIAYGTSSRLARHARPSEVLATGSEIEHILDLARWAPSGDNSQPWRFEILGDDRLIVRIRVEGENMNIYDYAGGQPTLLSGGFLLETIRIAASRFHRAVRWTYLGAEERETNGVCHLIEVILPKDETIAEDPLHPYIAIRSVDRRRYRMRRLTAVQKTELEAALEGELRIEWRETLRERWHLSCLCACSTDIRLRAPEAYLVHKRVLDWDRRFSPDGIPADAVGLDPLTLRAMQWVMQSWKRVSTMNRFFGGTAIPRIQLDIIPGLSSGGFFVLSRDSEREGAHTPKALLQTGERLQRFWLTATRLGLALQPTLAPLCFAHYGQSSTIVPHLHRVARLAHLASQYFPHDGSVLFLGRIGVPRRAPPHARSVRRSVARLTHRVGNGENVGRNELP